MGVRLDPDGEPHISVEIRGRYRCKCVSRAPGHVMGIHNRAGVLHGGTAGQAQRVTQRAAVPARQVSVFSFVLFFFFSCSLGNFKGLCKQIDHFPEDADYEADTAEYFLRKFAGPSPCNGS